MLVKTDIEGVRPLRCPRCGNAGGDHGFNADTYVLIKEGGLPYLVGDYTQELGADRSPPQIECHGCDYKGPIEEFRRLA